METNIPWYRRRVFWGGLLLAQVVTNFVIFSQVFKNLESLSDWLFMVVGLSGGVVVGVLVDTLVNPPLNDWITSAVFLIIACYLLYKTFNKKVVQLRYSIPLSLALLISTTIIYLFLSGLS